MSTYAYGASRQTQNTIRETADDLRARLEHLRRTRAAVEAEQAAKDAELARIRAARLRLAPVATYRPTAEALAYREKYGQIIAAQPAPLHGGRRGLQRAMREAQEYEAKKREINAA